ncbi:MAG: nucleotidyltransferase family protein [Candidatus Yonathbacteria bacterium]|nr:nucleotidyltransferase family protein [Candidatus Yonathbacteria bacterium]
MKALILSAGLGTRLRQLTETTPKSLLPINGKPLLSYHLESLYKYGVRDILINTHYLHKQINEFVKNNRDRFNGLTIQIAFEKELLGSAGTLKKNAPFFKGEDDFLVVYGDNLTNINYGKLIAAHKEKNGIATIASYVEEHPEGKGIISFNENGKILKFIEKPRSNKIISKYANAGIYVLNSRIFKYLNSIDKTPLDFGHDIFPYLLVKNEEMYVYKMDEILLDIGTPESYNDAQGISI